MAEPEGDRDWQRAASFAARAHDGQYRKDEKTPYVAHPFRVALTVRHVFGIDDRVALVAALLHDLIEDTKTDYDDILKEFGPEAADAVAALTKDARLPEPQREAAYDRALAAASWQARAVKLADVLDNCCDSTSPTSRTRAVEKARRAVVCAGDAPELRTAVAAVQEMIEDFS